MKIMGLDFGSKRIGVAMSDELFLIAHAFDFIQRRDIKRDLEVIRGLVAEHSISEIVVGLPLNMDGSYGAKSKEVIEFMDNLSKVVSVPVKTWDERLTSVQAERVLIEADMSRAKRRFLSDKVAAQIILQGYLDARKRGQDNA